jgi:alpha-glucosidase
MLKSLLSVTVAIASSASVVADVAVSSPDGKVSATFTVTDGRLTCTVQRAGTTILEPSPLGIVIDGVDLGKGVKLGEPETSVIDERYPWRGVKSEMHNHCNAVAISVTHSAGQEWTLEARAYNDGVAYRYVVPGEGTRRVDGETSGWRLPEGSGVWHRWNHPKINQFEHNDQLLDVTEIKKDFNFQFPATIVLPDGSYAALMESGTFNWSGLSLVATESTLITSKYNDDRDGFKWEGTIETPWRLVMTGPTLNDLVNSDLVHNCAPVPDPTLFPDGVNTEWIKTGRSLWQWWAFGDPGTEWDKQKKFVDQAAELNCDFYLVDAGWENEKFGWVGPEGHSWAKMKELCDYAKERGVDILVWRAWSDCKQGPGIASPKERTAFFENCAKVGVAGVKIDYLASEGGGRYKFTVDVLREAAENKLTVNFHGCPKPTGEARTWPNEVNREGIKGLEHNKWSALPPDHYASVPFTRGLAGHWDFTPVTFQEKMLKGTTFCLQLAMAVVDTSPVLCWADKPEIYLESPALDIIKTMPSTWDETIVLPGSEIGKLAVFARRKGEDWYVGIINGEGENAKSYVLELSFLGDNEYDALYCMDTPDRPDAMDVKQVESFKVDAPLEVQMNGGGGFVARFTKK